MGFRTTNRFEEGLKTAGLAIDSDKVFSKIGLLPSRLASLIFYKRHLERRRRSLNNGEPGIAEWLKICDDIVRPQLFRKFLRKMTAASCVTTRPGNRGFNVVSTRHYQKGADMARGDDLCKL
jgi:hypothetical protein